jgi:hypothetical protein
MHNKQIHGHRKDFFFRGPAIKCAYNITFKPLTTILTGHPLVFRREERIIHFYVLLISFGILLSFVQFYFSSKHPWGRGGADACLHPLAGSHGQESQLELTAT